MEKKYILSLILIAGIGFSSYTQAQTIVFSQNFEGSYTAIGSTAGSTVTIPSGSPANIPSSQVWTGTGSNSTTNTVWHRDDYSTGWTNTYDACGGADAPSSCAANGTSYSALFDGYDNQSGYTGSIQSPTFDLSAYCGGALTFYCFDDDETNLLVQFYNGATLAGTTTLTTHSTSWKSTSISVPSACLTSSCSIKFTATSGYAYYPIGVDEIVVTGLTAQSLTAQPGGLTFSDILSSSCTGSFTTASPVPNGGYLVVATTTSVTPTSPVNGTVYTAGSSALGGTIIAVNSTTTFSATGLSNGTKYWFWVYSMNTCNNYYTTSPLSNTCTTLLSKSWNGAGVSGGTGETDFNTAANWLPTTLPGLGDEAIITTTSSATITLSANSTLGALTVLNNATGTVKLVLDVQTNALSINGDFTENIKASAGKNTVLSTRVGNSPGNITVNGNTYIGTNSNISSYIEFIASAIATSVTGTVTFKGNTSFGSTYYPSTVNSAIGGFTWDGTGAQAITCNNIYPVFMTGNCQIGNANSPTVTVLGSTSNGMDMFSGNLTVNAGAVLDLTTNYWINYYGNGTFTNNGTLRLAGNVNGASSGNNFPGNFTVSTPTLAAISTVEYYSANGVNQTIYATPGYGNLIITNGSGSGATTKTAGAALTINGNTTINSLATFAASTYTHTLAGNFSNGGTFSGSTGTITFNGTAAQTLSGSSTTTFNNLTINNTSASGVTLSAPANVSSALALTAGLLNTSSTYSLTLQNGATAPALTNASTSYVNGPIVYQLKSASATTLNFPIGGGGDCRPVALTVTHTSATNTYNYTGQLFSGTVGSYTAFPATVDTLSGVHYWGINRTDASAVSQPTLELSGNQQIKLYFDVDDQVYDGSLLTICKTYTATGLIDIGRGSTSIPLTQSSTAEAGSITSSTSGPSAFNSFSSFTLARLNGAGKNPLPIQLVSFNAVRNGDKVDINWETATEENNDYFTIEKSKDGQSFTKLIDVKGSGNSTSLKEYYDSDYQPYMGISYYRIKQTDYNGNYTYFPIKSVTFNENQSIQVYPNPIEANTSVSVQVKGFKDQEVIVVLRDIQGREFVSKALLTIENNQVFLIDETKSLTSGSYIVTASSDNMIYSYKLLVR